MSIKKNISWNLFGSATPLIIGVAAIPYIYEKTGIERVGILTLVWALIGYFSIFDFGLGRAITQRIAGTSSASDECESKRIASTGIFLTLILGVTFGAVGFLAVNHGGTRWINSSTDLENEIYSSFVLVCLALPATTLTAGLRGILEGKQNFGAVNILKLLLGLGNFIGPLIAIYIMGPRLDYIVGSLVIARYVILVAHYHYARPLLTDIKNNFSAEESKQLFRFGGWMTLSNVVSPLMVVADRFLIANVLGASLVAYYTIPSEFIIRLLILPAAITTTLFPIFSKDFSEKNPSRSIELYRKSLKIIFFIMSLIAVCIILVADFGYELWLGKEFAEKSSLLTSILAVGVVFNSMAQIPHAYIQASGDARSTALIHLFESILYIPALFLLMHVHGLFGAAVAWMLRALLDLVLLQARAIRLRK